MTCRYSDSGAWRSICPCRAGDSAVTPLLAAEARWKSGESCATFVERDPCPAGRSPPAERVGNVGRTPLAQANQAMGRRMEAQIKVIVEKHPPTVTSPIRLA